MVVSIEPPTGQGPSWFLDATALVVYGAGGHGKCVVDLVRAAGGYRMIGIVDDRRPVGQEVAGVPVLGADDVLADLRAAGTALAANAVGGIGNIEVRVGVSERLARAGFKCPPLIHPSAVVEPSFVASPGLQVFPHAYIGTDVAIGPDVILNTGAVVSHDCTLDAWVNLSPGALLAGGVQVGSRTMIGMGATVNVGVLVGSGVRIGNSAVVKGDVPDNGVVRAGAIWPER